MNQLLHRLGSWLSAQTAQNKAVAQRALLDNVLRIKWVSLAVIPLNLLSVAIFWWLSPDGSAVEMLWKQAIGWVHVFVAAILLLMAWGAHVAARNPHARRSHLALTLAAFALVLGATIAFVTIDQAVTPSITPFVIGSILAGVLLLIRPVAAATLYTAAYLAFFFAIALTQHQPSQLLSSRMNGFSAVVLGLMLAVVLWRKNAMNELLHEQLERSHAALQDQQQQLEYLAAHDPLTGLVNRREFTRLAELEVVRALRYQTAVCAALLDLDEFKSINDSFGHPVGDRVLRHIAALLSGAVRATDVVARLGGEEFIILLPHTPLAAAQTLADKLRRLLEETPLELDELALRVTASFGVAELGSGDAGTFSRLYSDADKALYNAKTRGRNRVEVAGGGPSAAA